MQSLLSTRPGAHAGPAVAAAIWLLAAAVFPSLLAAQTAGGAAAPAAGPQRTILFFGDSLTAGYGLADPATEAFPALIQKKLDAAGLNWRVINAGLSGDTTAGGLRRIDWAMRVPINILVLELGANDGLRGLPVADTRRNLQSIIDRVKARNPGVRIVIAGMRLPPNFGADYEGRFAAIFPELVQANPGSILLPFLLQGVGGIPRYNQRDQIHPTAEGDRIIADTLWAVLEPLCRDGIPARS
jgi:acyl-CoA thioesterase-1